MFKNIWDRKFQSKDWGKYPDLSIVRLTKKRYKSGKGKKVLEIGFGGGANLIFFTLENFTTFGIDVSKNAKKQAYKNLKRVNKKARLEIGYSNNLPFEKKYFDLVVDCECLYSTNLKIFNETLLEIKRVLKPGKIFITKTFASGSYNDGYKKIRGGNKIYKNKKGFIKRYMNISDIYKFYGKYFKIISIEKEERTILSRKKKIKEWVIEMQNVE